MWWELLELVGTLALYLFLYKAIDIDWGQVDHKVFVFNDFVLILTLRVDIGFLGGSWQAHCVYGRTQKEWDLL